MTATVAPTTNGAKPKAEAPLIINKPDFRYLKIPVVGTSPLVINKFSHKAQIQMENRQKQGQVAKSRKAHEAKDFEALYEQCRHISEDGWDGFHAAAIRNACISACRAAGYTMTKAKLALFVIQDGFDRDDGTPLVRINGVPKMVISQCRNATGVIDLRPRAHFTDWSATISMRYDAGMLSDQDVCNLIARVGMQVGIGEGRPDSKNSAGLGFGLFDIVT